MPTGVIKRLVAEKGFGFISPADGGDDLFFHRSDVVDPSFEELERGETVEYDLKPADEQRPGGSATRVRLRAADVSLARMDEFRPLPRHRAALKKKPSWRKPKSV